MKILIIGAKGMLGQELVEVFSQDDEVLAWDREEIDITDKNLKSQISNLKFGLLINAAAYNDVDGAEQNQELANEINGYAVGRLAKICQELGVPMVHFSTEYVFDGTKQEGYKEDDKPSPISAYGQSKYLGEQELLQSTDKHYLVRLSRLFGKPAQAATGKKGFTELMLELSAEKDELDVVDEELSSPTYAPDLAKLTKELIMGDYDYGIYHGSNGGACTWYGFAKEIFAILDKDVKLNPVPADHFPRPASRPQYGILVNTKLPKQRSWQEALKEFLQTR